jgi:hypothetical protein
MKVTTQAPAMLPVLMVLFFLKIAALRLVDGNEHNEILEIRNPGEPTDGYGLPPPYGPITAESSTEDICE